MARKHLVYVPREPKYNYDKIVSNFLICFALSLIAFVVVGLVLGYPKEPDPNDKYLRFYQENAFQVNEARCKIPNMRATTIKELSIKREKLQPCKNVPILTTVDSTRNHQDPLVIKVHSDYLPQYEVSSPESVNCSYRVVYRKPGDDTKTYLSSIKGYFNNEIIIDRNIEHAFVSCHSNGKEFYKNVHAIVKRKEKFFHRQKATGIKRKGKKPYKVLMIGFSEMSRMNFARGMPNTYKYFQGEEWFEFKGFTRLSNNSFGNIFTTLTGQSASQRYKKCNPTSYSFLDNCDFIWKKFQKAGYVTAYAEDQKNQSSLNRGHKGFQFQPTDYYFRPFILEAEKNLYMRKKGDLGFCLGTTLYLDYIFVYAMKLIDLHESDPYFGFFYINSMNDKQLSSSPILDGRIADSVVKYIHERNESDLIMIYFSDRGLRFEESSMGFFEERLPLLSIRLPPQFQKDHPEIVSNLRDNMNRLTTPYDLHITLKHIINLSIGRTKYQKEAVGCTDCKSLFDKIPLVRSCFEAQVPAHSCPCSLVDVPHSKEVVQYAARHALAALNAKLRGDCKKLHLKQIIGSRHQRTSPWNLNYIVRFTVSPSKAEFEAIMSRKFSTLFSFEPKFELLQGIVHTNIDKEPLICIPKSTNRDMARKSEMDYDEDDDEVHYDLLNATESPMQTIN